MPVNIRRGALGFVIDGNSVIIFIELYMRAQKHPQDNSAAVNF